MALLLPTIPFITPRTQVLPEPKLLFPKEDQSWCRSLFMVAMLRNKTLSLLAEPSLAETLFLFLANKAESHQGFPDGNLSQPHLCHFQASSWRRDAFGRGPEDGGGRAARQKQRTFQACHLNPASACCGPCKGRALAPRSRPQ